MDRDKVAAYTLIRISLGVNMLGHGLFRILSGVGAFAEATSTHMAKSPLPASLVFGFSHAIPWIELLLGLGLIVGLLTRTTLMLGAIFLIGLTVGVTSNQQWDVAGQQLLYSLLFCGLLFGSKWNRWSLDHALRRDGSPQARERQGSPLQ